MMLFELDNPMKGETMACWVIDVVIEFHSAKAVWSDEEVEAVCVVVK